MNRAIKIIGAAMLGLLAMLAPGGAGRTMRVASADFASPSGFDQATHPLAASAGNVLVLGDSAQVSAAGVKTPAGGNGMVALNGQTTRRVTATNGQDGVGGNNGTSYRAYVEWDTSLIPKNVTIQSIGVYLDVTVRYGANKVSVTKLANPINSYANSAAGNAQLFADLASAPAYLSNVTGFDKSGGLVLPIGGMGSPAAINDLVDHMSKGLPFGIGIVGSNEQSAATSWFARQDTTSADLHPALVIFYSGIMGQQMGMIRPLRNSFWDGTNYWQFFTATTGQYYSYSPDGANWHLVGKLDDEANRHLGIWYDGNGAVWLTFSRLHAGLLTNNNDLVVEKGTISGNTINWSPPVVVFATATTSTGTSAIDGYDFPTIIKDSRGLCWIAARHYVTDGSSVRGGVEVKKSTDSTCGRWGAATTLTDVQYAGGAIHAHGGYVVPLTNGKVYAVYKDTDGSQGQIYGQLFDGTWRTREVIESSTVVGVYLQGLAVVANGDVVSLIYVGGDGSIKYKSWSGQWSAPVTVDSGSTFYSPALSLDTATGDLYAFYRSTGSNTNANAGVFYKVGSSPFGSSNWSSRQAISSTSWTPQSMMIGDAFWNLSSNYSSKGAVMATFVDGAYGLRSAIIPTRAATKSTK